MPKLPKKWQRNINTKQKHTLKSKGESEVEPKSKEEIKSKPQSTSRNYAPDQMSGQIRTQADRGVSIDTSIEYILAEKQRQTETVLTPFFAMAPLFRQFLFPNKNFCLGSSAKIFSA